MTTAALTEEMVALVARHRRGIGRLLARSLMPPERVLVIIARVESAVGRSFLAAGLQPAPGRQSLAIPTDLAAARMFTDALDQPEVRVLTETHGATPLLVFDSEGRVGVTFERFA